MWLFLSQHPNGACHVRHEPEHSRELQLERAWDATRVAISGQADWERNVPSNLQMEFEQTLEDKAVKQ
jgi:hypothetical protein